MRAPVFALTSISCLLLVSCSQNKLPTIKDPETLRKDCTVLYQQFPVIEDTNQIAKYGNGDENGIVQQIPKNNWPLSIQNLEPLEVKRSKLGIYIWIKTNNSPAETFSANWVIKGYFVSCSSNFTLFSIKSNVPFFKETGLPRIYEILKPAEAE